MTADTAHDRCPVCGNELRERITACGTCPMSGGCDMVGCDNCGYHTVAPRSTLVDLVKRFSRWWQRNDHGAPGVS